MSDRPPETRNVDGLLERAQRQFVERFGERTRWGAIAPGRVNLIGDHTDYNQGFVLPMAIDRYTVVLAGAADGGTSTIWAADLSEQVNVNIRQPLTPMRGSFANYVLGVVQQFLERGASVPNLNLMIAGDLPRGAGLSSSASVEVAAATLLEQITGIALSPRDKAFLCQRAEHTFAGVPCGIMDMYAISMARASHAMLIDCRTNEHQHVPFPGSDEAALLVIDTGAHRKLAAGEYQRRRTLCESAARCLGIQSLRDATMERVNQLQLSREEFRAARHVVSENARVMQAAAALRARDFALLGEAMFASHDSLRDDFQVSVDELNVVVEAARSLRRQRMAVWGARMTGAGFGGCAVALCHPGAVAELTASIAAAFKQQFAREPGSFRTIAVAGAGRVPLVG